MVAKFLAGVDVRHMHFNNRRAEHRQGVAQTVAVMRPSTRVNHQRVSLIAQSLVDSFDHLAFVVRLKTLNGRAKLAAQCLHARVDLGQRRRAVLRRVALTEHVEIDAVQNKNFHGEIQKFNRALSALSQAKARQS